MKSKSYPLHLRPSSFIKQLGLFLIVMSFTALTMADSSPESRDDQIAPFRPQTITLLDATDNAPFVEISATNAAKLTLGLPIVLYANTTGDVQTVEFFVNETSIGNASYFGGRYREDWLPSAAGTYTLVAKAIGQGGLATTSAPVQLTIGEITYLQIEHPATNQLVIRFNPAQLMPTTLESSDSLESGVWTQVTKELSLGYSAGEERITFEETPTEAQRFYRIRARQP